MVTFLIPFYGPMLFRLFFVFLTRLAPISHCSVFRVPIHWIGFGYAALVASGGIIGYARAGTVCSYLTA